MTNPSQSRYVQLVIQSNDVSWEANFLASVSNWLLLAGYLVVPGTFTSLEKSEKLGGALEESSTGQAVLNTIQNPPLLTTACFLFCIGSTTMAALYWRQRGNYIWLMNKLFMPTLMNSLAGLLTTTVNICTARSGDMSIMGLLTIIASGISAIFSAALIAFLFREIKRMKQDHQAMVRLQDLSVHHVEAPRST
ncbi:hypothetical protein N7532_001394 [Penicillium argentinense]|uniref:Uncharacterized protein n=1 Tax=Penicillium argentinense TaxID=1131581 RepID=A0A9W9G2D5_9EURO|nr:uncharacterized protein N7532_001394 [Penicillium argentinense]KAJ5110859.1 hypothetical protein N7532_001394 [Penicillium argentinense]